MKRREAILQLMVIAGGITLIPSCLDGAGKASISLKNIMIDDKQEALLAEIASTIIPKTDTPGAKEVGSHLFVLKMLDDCYENEVQQKFIKGLNELDKASIKRFKNSFVKCSREQREKMLQSVEHNESFAPEVFDFYRIMKQETLQGYMTSKFVLDNIVKYEMIPSVAYNGYYPVKNLKNGRQS